jgi:hypothetical protein
MDSEAAAALATFGERDDEAPLIESEARSRRGFAKLARVALFTAAVASSVAAVLALRPGLEESPSGATVALEPSGLWATTYCHENQPSDDCWIKKPPKDTSLCTVDSGETLCKCVEQAGSGCDVVDMDSSDRPLFGVCGHMHHYIYAGEKHENSSTHSIDVTGKKYELFCSKMIKADKFYDRHLVKWPSDGPATSNSNYWKCRGDYTWENGKCQRKTRYLGETCWGGSKLDPAGLCVGQGEDDPIYKMACYEGFCRSIHWAKERKRCECAWVGWNFIVACTAHKGVCGGHACVLTTYDMNKYCDYWSDQNW